MAKRVLPEDLPCCICDRPLAGKSATWQPRQRRYAHTTCMWERRVAAGARRRQRAAADLAEAQRAERAVESEETAAIRRLMGRR